MSRLYENDEIREHAEKMVRNNVLLNVSSLIESLNGIPRGCEGLALDDEEFWGLFTKTKNTYTTSTDKREFDDRDAAEDHARDLMDVETHSDPSTGRVVLYRTSDGETFDDKDAAELHGCMLDDIDETSETFEACEHWVVDRGLAERLEARGEIVQDTCIGHIWGRGTSGQGIAMDGVILEIARDALDFLKAPRLSEKNEEDFVRSQESRG